MPPPAAQIHLVDQQTDLAALVRALADQQCIAVDTEFNRTSTYRPELCLIQLAAHTELAVVDVLAGGAEVLQAPLAQSPALKLFHAAKQDMEALWLNLGWLPNRILDTQIGAALLGFPPQVGYATLVAELLEVRLDKTETRTDWSKRPLSPAQLTYAAEDVIHLYDLYEVLQARLQAAGRDAWAMEDSAALLDPALYELPPAEAWRRLGGLAYLPVAVQARARALAAWREARAAHSNRPRQWVLTDRALLGLATDNPASPGELARSEELPAGLVRRQGQALLEVLADADRQLAAGSLELEQARRPDRPDKARLQSLAALLKRHAAELQVAPEVLATRRELEGLLRGELAQRVTSGWRREVVGEALLAAL